MKYLAFLIPFVFIGCASAPKARPIVDEHATCSPLSSASGTTGNVRYTCNKMACNNEDNTFRCEFVNLTDQMQPGPAIKIALYSGPSRYRKFQSNTIYSSPLLPSGSDVKWISWHKSKTADICGRSLNNCVYLTEMAEGLKILIKD